MRYRLMATYRGVPYEAGIGPTDEDVVLFAACPPPEELGFEPATGHWRKQLRIQDVQALWESRPMGTFRGDRCIVLDDLGDRLHIAYLGHDGYQAEQLGYWEVDRGVFELITPRDEVEEIVEERLDYPHQRAAGDPLAETAAPVPPPARVPAAAEFAAAANSANRDAHRAGADEPHLTGPHAARPQANEIHLTGPHAARPQANEIHLTGPHAARISVTGPYAVRPQADEPHLTGPHAVSPQAGEPYLTGPHAVRPQADAPPPAAPPATAPPATPLHAAAPLATAPPATAPPATAPPATPLHAAAPPATAPQTTPLHAAAPPATAPQTTPLHAASPAAAPPSTGLHAARSGAAEPGAAGPAPAGEPALPLEAAARAAASARDLRPADPPAPEPGPESPRHRRSELRRLATQRIFSELAGLAAIPPSAYAVGEEVDGAMCLIQTPEGFEVFNAAAGSRHEVRIFDDEESAYFYLFGVLAAEAVRTGRLAPQG
jgi:hypothetical protein